MKFLAVIISFFVITLNISPVLEMIDHADEEIHCSTSCCAPSPDQQAEGEQEDGCEDNCNPFMSCCTCLGVPVPAGVAVSGSVSLEDFKNRSYTQPFSALFTHSIWHPPRVG